MTTSSSIRSILLPTDFSNESQSAFAHALRLATVLGASLELLYVESENYKADWSWGPKVRQTLIQWGELPEDADDDALARLGISVRSVTAAGKEPTQAIMDEMVASHADLIVMATHGRVGLDRWLQPSVVAPMVKRPMVPVLLLPPGGLGFVEPNSGANMLDHVLVAVDNLPDPSPALKLAEEIAVAASPGALTFSALHVGKTEFPDVVLPKRPDWKVEQIHAPGSAVEAILNLAASWPARLIAMTSEGENSLLDTLRGSHAGRVFSEARCPVLIVPAGWGIENRTGREAL